jgi:hypothetical protein
MGFYTLRTGGLDLPNSRQFSHAQLDRAHMELWPSQRSICVKSNSWVIHVGNPAGRLLFELNNHMTGCDRIQKMLVVGSLAVGYSKCPIDGHLQPLTIIVTDV